MGLVTDSAERRRSARHAGAPQVDPVKSKYGSEFVCAATKTQQSAGIGVTLSFSQPQVLRYLR